MSEAASLWDRLHDQPRFRPSYPAEPVVRFLARLRGGYAESRQPGQALDIGVGGGRHTSLLADFGFRPCGIDISLRGLAHARDYLRAKQQRAGLAMASMTMLPFPSDTFDAAVSYGVYCYGRVSSMKQAIAELHRVLRPGGSAFVMLRTAADYRYGKGEQLEPQTFRLTISETNEEGTVQHFLREEDVPSYFARFASVAFEKTETTADERRRVDSDWLITLRK